MLDSRLPQVLLPTPCHPLAVGGELGLDLWIKRDDLTGFAMGGNKGRKLRYIMADLVERGVKVAVTCGSAQSNFVRQFGAACSIAGIECHAAVMDLPFDSAAGKPSMASPKHGGNLLLDELYGVRLHHFPDDDWEVLFDHMNRIAAELGGVQKGVEVVPVGGSVPLGAFAFAEAASELEGHFDFVIHASSSGSTQVGLATAFYGSKTRVIGIACDPEPEISKDFSALSTGLAAMKGLPSLAPEDFEIDFRFVGPGYGVPSEDGDAALKWLAARSGILLDPVYSAKAFAGLVYLARAGEIGGRVLFWHTGGQPSVFAYS